MVLRLNETSPCRRPSTHNNSPSMSPHPTSTRAPRSRLRVLSNVLGAEEFKALGVLHSWQSLICQVFRRRDSPRMKKNVVNNDHIEIASNTERNRFQPSSAIAPP